LIGSLIAQSRLTQKDLSFTKKDLKMKTFIALLVGSTLMIGAVGCDNVSKTSSEAPANTDKTISPSSQATKETKNDATSSTRKAQIESDIRAREQRSNITGGDTKRANGDLQSEVRGKLEANIPTGKLTVDAKDGIVTIGGTVSNKAQLDKIEPLAKQIKGVSSVVNKVKVASTNPS
jgi:hyperosmotically inducible periplasmic protein